MRWKEGLALMIWHDVPGSFMSEGSGSTTDPVYRIHGYAESQDGLRFDWELETSDGKTAQFRIDNTSYDLADGALFIITTKNGETEVKQLRRDLSGVQAKHESCVAFAKSDPEVARFIGDTPNPKSEPTPISTPAASASTPAASPQPPPLAPHRPAITQVRSSQGQGVWTNYWLPDESEGSVRNIAIDPIGRVWISYSGNVSVLDADDNVDVATWTTYTAADGLPGDSVWALAVDDNGYVWIGTRAGIGVFDGSVWTTYTTADGLGDNWVKAIAVDALGQVWVGTADKMSRFDGHTWETIENAPMGVTAIDFDQAGRVWVGHQEGVSVFDGTSWTHYTAANDFALHFVNEVTIDSEDKVWVSNGICIFHSADCTNIGLSQFDGQSWINHRKTYAHNNNSGDLAYEIAVDDAGKVWVGTASGVMSFDGQSWITYTQADGLAQGDRYHNGAVYAVAIDPAGPKWLGTQTTLTRFDDTPGAVMTPLPPQPRIEIEPGMKVLKVGDTVTIAGVPVAIGMPHYTLYLDSDPAVTVTYSGEITYQGATDSPLEFVSASATNSRVEYTLRAIHPGSLEVSIGATGEVRIDYGDGTGAWAWGGADPDSIVIMVVQVLE